ncbi:MAG: radical SAM protein [Oscillospiraceae bacterium]|jgi:radical SAM protein with 4Fe4S-binding SPASM domain|nr:radical SAM protein [Oscillospiraceae bacterium]
MKYLRLKDDFALRGWDKLPYAIVNQKTGRAVFLNKEQFKALKLCDGTKENAQAASLPEFADFRRMGIEQGFLEEHTEYNGSGLKDYQRYKKFDCRYIKGIQWSITGKCNLKCRHCYVSAPDCLHGELSFKDCLHIIEQLESAGVAEIFITGGEPLFRADFWDLIDILIEKRFAITQLYTNGLLADDKFLAECEKRKLKWTFCLSFDGVNCHDWLRGISGVEAQTIRAIQRIKEAGHRIAVSTALHGGNIDSLTDTFHLLKSLSVDYWKTSQIVDTGGWKDEQAKNSISTRDLYEAYLRFIPLYRAYGMPMTLLLGGFYYNLKNIEQWNAPLERFDGTEKMLNQPVCGICRTHLYLLPDGKILPCIPMCGTSFEYSADNTLKTPLTEILKESSEFFSFINTRIRELYEKNKICASCEFKLKCGGCRAIALQNEHNIYGIDTLACYYFKNNYRSKIENIITQVK